MLALLRFFHTLLRPLAGPAAATTDTCVTRWRVWPGDIDVFGHMNNSRYLVLMDLARIDFLRRCNLFKGVLRERWSVPVGASHMNYRHALKPFERFELHTTLVSWDAQWFYFRQDFVRPADRQRPVCTGYVKTLFAGRAGKVPTARVIASLHGAPLPRPAMTPDLREAMGLPAEAPRAVDADERSGCTPDAPDACGPAAYTSAHDADRKVLAVRHGA